MMEKAKVKMWRRLAIGSITMVMIAGGASGVGAKEAVGKKVQLAPPTATFQVEGMDAGKPFIYQQSDSQVLGSAAHQRHYWKLLAAVYTPELSKDWEKALEERKEVESSFQAKITISHAPINNQTIVLNDANASMLTEKSVTITVSDAGKTLRLGKKPINSEVKEDDNGTVTIVRAELSEEMKRMQAFHSAVENGDEEAIRKLLPELLEDYRKQTETLKADIKKLNELQQKQETKQ